MSRIIAWLAEDNSLLCVHGRVEQVYISFSPDDVAVSRSDFVSCAGLYGTDHLAPRDLVDLGNADRRRFARSLPALAAAAPQAAAALAKALEALPPTTSDKTVKRSA